MTDTFPDAPRPPDPEHGAGTTLGLIAREANVSIGTVSKVLNGRKGISPATRARVEELMELHGYSRRGAERPHGALIEIVLEVVDTGFSVMPPLASGFRAPPRWSALWAPFRQFRLSICEAPAFLSCVRLRRQRGDVASRGRLCPDGSRPTFQRALARLLLAL